MRSRRRTGGRPPSCVVAMIAAQRSAPVRPRRPPEPPRPPAKTRFLDAGGCARPGGEGGGGRAVVRPSAGCSAGGPRPRRRGREARVSGAATGGQGPAAEIAAIERVVAAVEHSQNNELPEEFVVLFRAD